jgi:hypothetical protein
MHLVDFTIEISSVQILPKSFSFGIRIGIGDGLL